jgi:drug/metabolite transporter (DMT)-like permease
VIYGLIAAIGWGAADFFGAVSGRRLGSVGTVFVAQALSAVATTVVVLVARPDLSGITSVAGWVVVNGIVSCAAYASHYKALELGPVAVVSPIGAGYALVGLLLAVVFRGERPGALAIVGGAVTVGGVMLASTDLRALRDGVRGNAPGVPWSLAAAVFFGGGAFLLGFLSQEIGWEAGLWSSRCAQLLGFSALVLVRRYPLRRIGANAGTGAALLTGAFDLLGVVSYSIGTAAGFISIILVSSAVFPLLAVALSVAFLRERLVANQYVGVVLVVAGLVMLGAG